MRQLDFKKGPTKALVIAVVFTVFVICIIIWWATRPKRPFISCALPPIEKALEDGTERGEILKALYNNPQYLEKKQNTPTYSIGNLSVDRETLKKTTRRLISIFQSPLSINRNKLNGLKAFEIRGEVLVTGYYLPEFEASRRPNTQFNTPIYGVPPDLITVRLKDFVDDPRLRHLTLRGRVKGNTLIPYYTRAELDRAKGIPVIAYLNNPVEHLILQIQGSGILKYPDGTTSYVHYAADNGFPYKSVGRILIEKGLLTKDKADWPGIMDWFRENPEKFKEIVNQNPRFIFFKEEPHVSQAIGAQGVELTPFHSIAVDPALLPFGGIFFVEVSIPGHGTLKTLVVAQDKGGAIKGYNHIDLYVGRGEKAGHLAGTLKAHGRLILIVVNDT